MHCHVSCATFSDRYGKHFRTVMKQPAHFFETNHARHNDKHNADTESDSQASRSRNAVQNLEELIQTETSRRFWPVGVDQLFRIFHGFLKLRFCLAHQPLPKNFPAPKRFRIQKPLCDFRNPPQTTLQKANCVEQPAARPRVRGKAGSDPRPGL